MFSKIRIKSFLLGVLVASCALTLVQAVAGIPMGKNITAYFDKISVVVNGVEKVSSSDMQTFIYNGRAYVGLKFIGEVFGKKVTWDEKNKKIFINGIDVIDKEYKSIELFSKYYIENKGFDITDKTSAKVTLSNGESRQIVYPLNGQAKSFSCALDQYGGYCNVYFEFLDENDKLIYKSPPLITVTDPLDVNIDCSNLQQLKIKVTAIDGRNSSDYSSCEITKATLITKEY